jgi:hypothetical protein
MLMRNPFTCLFSLFLILAFTGQSFAQQTQASSAASSTSASPVPRLIKFSGVLLDHQGEPLKGPVGVTFSLYAQQSGDSPLWMETQNVELDRRGVYTVLLGANTAAGLPEEMFRSGEARWLGIQPERESELPPVLLVSAPYALKAADAETPGGLPASAFMLASSPGNVSVSAIASAPVASASGSASPATATNVTTTGGTANYLPIFNGAFTIIDSVLYQSGTGTTAKVGINTTSPAATLDVKGSANVEGPLTLPATGTATASAGASSQPQKFVASSFSSISTAVNQTFQWEAEAAANDSASPSGTLNLLYGLGATAPSETGLKVNSKGIFTFATGQTFPGTGRITAVTAGTDLTGGGTTGNVTLNLDTLKSLDWLRPTSSSATRP